MRSGMRSGWVRAGLLVLGGAMLAPTAATAQLRVRARAFAGVNEAGQATTVEAALRMMTDQAAVAFVGTVGSVRRLEGDGFAQAQGVVEVTFTVERAIRGVSAGEVYTLREWGGLWSATDARYVPGSRLLMLLHAPSASGLSSPVGGSDGAIPVRGGAGRVGAGDGTTASATQMVDLRWLQAKLVQTTGWSRGGAQTGLQAQTRMVANGTGDATAQAGPAAGAERSVAAAQASVESVLQMMTQWTEGAR